MSSIVTPAVSVLDVLDDFFGSVWGVASVESLSDAELLDLAEAVNDHYSRARLPSAKDGVVRHYCGGASFMQPSISVPGMAVPMPTLPSGNMIPFTPGALLYADELVINCPLDSWICRHRGSFRVPLPYVAKNGVEIALSQPAAINDDGFWRSPMELNRQRISQALGMLADLEPGIRSGWLTLVPHLRYWKQNEQAIWSQVRRDVMDLQFMDLMNHPWKTEPAVSDVLRGFLTIPTGGYIPKDHNRALTESPSLYFNATLAVAATAQARFLPTADSDYGMLAHKIKKATMLNRQLRDGLLVHAMESVLVPDVRVDNFEDVMSIRADSESFADWRRGLENIVSGVGIPSNVTLEECQQLVTESLRDRVEGIREEGRSRASLGSRLTQARMESIDVGVAAALWMIEGASVPAVISGMALLFKAALQVLNPSVDGRSSVLLRLDKAGVTS
jgi:hypothetical protein